MAQSGGPGLQGEVSLDWTCAWLCGRVGSQARGQSKTRQEGAGAAGNPQSPPTSRPSLMLILGAVASCPTDTGGQSQWRPSRCLGVARHKASD